MVLVLRIVAWFGIAVSTFNASVKLFGNTEALVRYAQDSRDIYTNLVIYGFCLILLALAAILSELRQKESN